MLAKIKLWIENLTDKSNDPVYLCQVYKEIGCSHIDGMLCDMKACPILRVYSPKQGG